MSGLFQTLNARFTGQATPDLRLRGRARFETYQDDPATLEEQVSETTVPPSLRPADDVRNDVPPAPLDATRDQLIAPRAELLETPIPRPSQPEQKEETTQKPSTPPSVKVPTPAQADQFAVSDGPAAIETSRMVATPASPPDPPNPGVEVREDTVEMYREVITREVVDQQTSDTPIKTRPVQAAPEPFRHADAPEPAPSTLNVSVKIGKVEVKAPPKPAPPAPKPRPAPPQPRATDRGGPQSSKLTNYLGWKR